jgi:hypothetical protein
VVGDYAYVASGEWGVEIVQRAPMLTPNYVSASPSTPLTYTVTWLDSEVPQDVQVDCWVTGGTCAVTALDQGTNQATVEWRDAPLLEDHEIVVAVGNQQYFITAKDRVSFVPVE